MKLLDQMLSLITEGVLKSGFQALFMKDPYGLQGKGWNVCTCASDCACSPGCHRCPVYLLSLKNGNKERTPAEYLVDNLLQPMKLKRPRVIFVCPQGDIFHRDIPRLAIAQVCAVVDNCPDHCFVFLTKRAQRMVSVFSDPHFRGEVEDAGRLLFGERFQLREQWMDNILAGVSVETQKYMDRVRKLPELPKPILPVIFASPMLGALELPPEASVAGWVVHNSERGKSYCKPRPCKEEWVYHLVQQCHEAGIPFYSQDQYSPQKIGKFGADIREFPRHRFFQQG